MNGLSENTLVVFTSDNGGEIGVTTNAPLRAGRSTLYEGGLRDRDYALPARIKPGITEATPIITTDYYPTFLEVAGVRLTGDRRLTASASCHSSKARQASARYSLLALPLASPHAFSRSRSSGAIRHGDFKLEFYDTGKVESTTCA